MRVAGRRGGDGAPPQALPRCVEYGAIIALVARFLKWGWGTKLAFITVRTCP